MRVVLLLCFVFSVSFCKNNIEQLDPITEIKEVLHAPTQKQEVNLSMVMGNYEPSTHESFTLIDKSHADREGLYLQKEAYTAFQEMSKAAEAEGIKLTIRSATRNFDYQRGIWERKWAANLKNKIGASNKSNALNILEYSSMPSTSRHHWGTDIDLNSFENSWFESGEGLVLYNWMEEHAGNYGFCQVYTAKDSERPNGYNEEKWHWSYLPIADEYYKLAKEHMSDDMISGFSGAGLAKEIKVVDKYILGIDKSCQ